MGLTTPVAGRNDAGSTRVGLPKLDAVGLFVQWLAEAVTQVTPEYDRLSIDLHHEPPSGVGIKLAIRFHEGRVVKAWRWEVQRLNRLMEASGGRGELLREEIQVFIEDLREELGL